MLRIFCLLVVISPYAVATSGIYITSASGWAAQNSLPSAYSAQARATEAKHYPALRLGIGYLHDFNTKFGLGFEVGRGWYHGTTYNFAVKTITADSRTIEFLAVFAWHQQPFDFFVKLGGIRHTLQGFAAITAATDASETRIQPEIGCGINYNFTVHFALTAEYLHSFGNKLKDFVASSLKCPSIDAVLVGVRITFW